jgi:hypothetical protein
MRLRDMWRGVWRKQTHADGSRVLRKSSFVLFDSSEDGGEAPLGQSSDTLTFNDTDKQQLRALRRLWSSFPKCVHP